MGFETDQNDNSETAPLRLVVCPNCKGGSVFHTSNPSRPFCSLRCRSIDLGAWANEEFRVPDRSSRGDLDFDDV
jgi:uncharacterized protein